MGDRDNFWEGQCLVPSAPLISFEKSLISWGHAHVFKAAWTLFTAILPRSLEVLIPYCWCCWEAGPRFPMFFFIHLFLISPCSLPILGTKHAFSFLLLHNTLNYYRTLYSHSFTRYPKPYKIFELLKFLENHSQKGLHGISLFKQW